MNGAIGFDGLLTGNIATGGTGTTDYNDLQNKPSINGVSLYGNKTSADLHLFTGDYDNLSNKPSINNVVLTGNKTAADLNLFDGDYDNLTNKPTLFSGDYNDLTNKPTLFSGDYDDLTNKPTLFDGDYDSLNDRPQINGVTLTGDQTADDLRLFDGDYDHLTNKPTLFSGDYNDLYNKPTLFSGDYNDLTNKPTLFDGNYMSLTNRPYINGVALENNKTTSDLLISYNDLLDLPTIPGIEFNPADPATDEVETIDLDGTIYEVKDADARAEISLLEDDIAPEYDATATYSTGDYCMYAGTIYEANTNISTPEAFTPGHWDATSAGEELSQIKQSLSQLQGVIIYKNLTPSDDYAEFYDGSSLPLISLTSNIEYTQSGSGDPSPTNPRTINGYTDIDIVVSPNDDFSGGTTYTTNFIDSGNPLTVYEGYIDLINGKLTITRAYYDMGNINWVYSPSSNVFGSNQFMPYFKTNGKIACSHYKWNSTINLSPLNLSEYEISGSPYFNTRTVMIKDSRYTDPAAFKTAVSGYQLVYELDTPISYQLTPTQIYSLLGQNYINSDTGNITNVKYLGILNFS